MLKIRFTDGRRSAIALQAPGKTIGKGSANDIVIDEEGVNSFHADLKIEGDAVTISDVNTAEGTLVNGQRISAATLLKAGDRISIGGVDLEVFEIEADAATKTLALSGKALLAADTACWALIVDSGPEKGQVIPIVERIEIGRALGCDISILEASVSRRQAELIPRGPDLLLRDLDSANGSMVNGEKVDVANLRDKDLLEFGKVRFIVRAP